MYKNVATEMSRDRNGPDRNGLTEKLRTEIFYKSSYRSSCEFDLNEATKNDNRFRQLQKNRNSHNS